MYVPFKPTGWDGVRMGADGVSKQANVRGCRRARMGAPAGVGGKLAYPVVLRKFDARLCLGDAFCNPGLGCHVLVLLEQRQRLFANVFALTGGTRPVRYSSCGTSEAEGQQGIITSLVSALVTTAGRNAGVPLVQYRILVVA